MTLTAAQKHTPLPWNSCKSGECYLFDANGEPVHAYEEGGFEPGDAAFIVRACNSHYELLANLKQCVVCLQVLDPENPAIRMAEATIAKATGAP